MTASDRNIDNSDETDFLKYFELNKLYTKIKNLGLTVNTTYYSKSP